jgi:hypothetical protein
MAQGKGDNLAGFQDLIKALLPYAEIKQKVFNLPTRRG